MSPSAKAPGYLLFISKSSGYELAEREGDSPAPGDAVEVGETKFTVMKIGTSPLPGDSRPCAYLEPV
jgi:hypothetical protein